MGEALTSVGELWKHAVVHKQPPFEGTADPTALSITGYHCAPQWGQLKSPQHLLHSRYECFSAPAYRPGVSATRLRQGITGFSCIVSSRPA